MRTHSTTEYWTLERSHSKKEKEISEEKKESQGLAADFWMNDQEFFFKQRHITTLQWHNLVVAIVFLSPMIVLAIVLFSALIGVSGDCAKPKSASSVRFLVFSIRFGLELLQHDYSWILNNHIWTTAVSSPHPSPTKISKYWIS